MKAAKGTGHGAEQPLLASRQCCRQIGRPPTPVLKRSVEIRLADARNEADLREAIRGSDAVNVVGGGTLHKNDVESTTSRIAVAAAMK